MAKKRLNFETESEIKFTLNLSNKLMALIFSLSLISASVILCITYFKYVYH